MKIIPMFGAALCAIATVSMRADTPGIDRRVDELLGRLTLEQRIDMIGGESPMNIPAVPGIGLPGLKMSNGPVGVKNWGMSTAYAGGIGLAASWDRNLARREGRSMGRDCRARGVDFLEGPGLNIYRSPLNGRNFEYFGEDPFLAGALAVPFVAGVQGEGVVATVKHYAANNSEFDRHNTDSIVDERTLREIYLPAFEAAVVDGHVGSVMGSYNLVNGEHASQSRFLNVEVLKRDWGFRGILMSDWLATYDGVAAANNGLDLEMPTGKFMNRKTLLPAIKSGQVAVATIDDKVRRILRVALEFHLMERERVDASIPLFDQQSRAVALESAQESIVMLKNEGGILPLDARRVKRIEVLGPCSHPAVVGGGGSSRMMPFESVSLLTGLRDALAGSDVTVDFGQGVKDFEQVARETEWAKDPEGAGEGLRQETYPRRDFSGEPQLALVRHIDQWFEHGLDEENPAVISRRFEGYYIPKKTGMHTVTADCSWRDAYTLFVDGRKLIDQPSREGQRPQSAELDLVAGKAVAIRLDYLPVCSRQGMALGIVATDELVDPDAVARAARADVAVVSVGFDFRYEGERVDRSFRLPVGQDALIRAVEAVNPRTVVVLTGGGGMDVGGWIDRTPALLHGFYGGQEGGRAMAQVLLGQVNPSGHLPISFERRLEDNPATAHYYPAAGGTRVVYGEGIFLGYRHYDRSPTKPLFPFGHGLSYTTFEFSELKVSPAAALSSEPVVVSFQVRNNGRRTGAEVAQVYVGDPSATVDRPLRELKGFERVVLEPGESRRVVVTLGRRAFAYWDLAGRGWKVDPGRFTIHAGDSSANLPLQADLVIRN